MRCGLFTVGGECYMWPLTQHTPSLDPMRTPCPSCTDSYSMQGLKYGGPLVSSMR